ncbi:MAG TPA: HAD family hydrolase [Acidimicrobiia bacterium]|nr:HAD family hydrolase [Acidimicrobiia bacterium]
MIRVEAGGVVFEVEAVAFDKDGTLIDLDSAWGPAARHWVEAAAAGDLDLAKDLASSLGLDVDTGRLLIDGPFAVGTVRALYETTLAVLSSHGVGLDEAHLKAEHARETSAEAGEAGNLVPLGNVAGVFRALREAGARLAVVSNDDRKSVDAAVAALGIGSLLDAVLAGDDGFDPKPAPDGLTEVASRLSVEPGRMLYVGDSWVDATAGRAAGLAGIVLVGDPPPEARELASVVVPGVDSLRVT